MVRNKALKGNKSPSIDLLRGERKNLKEEHFLF
jgi:hypothetical protein